MRHASRKRIHPDWRLHEVGSPSLRVEHRQEVVGVTGQYAEQVSSTISSHDHTHAQVHPGQVDGLAEDGQGGRMQGERGSALVREVRRVKGDIFGTCRVHGKKVKMKFI